MTMLVRIYSTLVLLSLASIPCATAYTSSLPRLVQKHSSQSSYQNSLPTKSILLSNHRLHLPKQTTSSFLQSQNNNSDQNDESSPLTRFISPQISDPGLPLADALLAQIVAPSLQVFWLVSQSAPSPTWLQPLFPTAQLFTTRGTLVAPTLIHGALLASCWLLASLAAKGYEYKGFDVTLGEGYSEVLWRLVKAGAFAVGLLVLLTQLDLFFEFGGRFVQYGDGEESDLRIITATVEVINDCFFEGIVLGSWRLYRASLTAEEESF